MLFYGCTCQTTKTFFHWKYMESFTKDLPQILQLVLITEDAILTVNRSMKVLNIYQLNIFQTINFVFKTKNQTNIFSKSYFKNTRPNTR